MIAYQINSNLEAAIRSSVSILQSLNLAYQNGLFAAGTEAVKLIKKRIQGSGASADGEVLFTRSRANDGAYSQRHGTARRLKGLQISRVDLTFTGDMMADFGILSSGKGGLQVGFSSSKQAEKLEKLEAYYGADIMTASDEEEEKAIERIEDEFFKVIDKVFA